MNKEIMRRNYEKTSKETLINILISSRETIQNKNKEIVRLNNIINKAIKYIEERKIILEAIAVGDDGTYSTAKETYDNLLKILGVRK